MKKSSIYALATNTTRAVPVRTTHEPRSFQQRMCWSLLEPNCTLQPAFSLTFKVACSSEPHYKQECQRSHNMKGKSSLYF